MERDKDGRQEPCGTFDFVEREVPAPPDFAARMAEARALVILWLIRLDEEERSREAG